MVALLLGAGLSEGLGIAALLPLLELGTAQTGQEPSVLSQAVSNAFHAVGLEPGLGPLLVFIVVAMAMKGTFRWLAMREVGYVVARVAMDLRLRLIRGLMRAEWKHFTGTPTGFFATSISSEAHGAASAYREACAGLALVFQVAAYAFVVWMASWKFANFAIVVGAVLMVVLRSFVSASRAAGRRQVEVLRSLVGRLTEALPGLKPIKAMALEPHVLPLLEAETEEFYRAQQKEVLASESLNSFQEPLMVAALGLGLYGVLSLTSTPFAVVMVLSVLFYRLVGSMNQLQQRYTGMVVGENRFWSIMGHIEAAEDAVEQRPGTLDPPPLKEGITFEEVSFSYTDHPVLEGISLQVPAGAFVAFLGPSGAGKTTLADLVIGLLRPSSGRVLVDGVDLQDLDQARWRSKIGYVPQDLLLFHDTILKNVTLGDEAVDRAEVERALRAAGAWDFVGSLPQGMDTVVGERGGRLSGGQRQRIAIARALVGQPQVLILDEATTALDPATEAEICQSLLALRGKVTILAISHQPAMRRVADLSFEVNRGSLRPAT
jgi:ATP-binding cassette subfamily C protein